MLEAMLSNMDANIASLLCLWSVGNLGSIFTYIICQCVVGCTVIVLYLSLVKLCIQCIFHAIFQKFCIISIGTGMISIATFKVQI